MTVRDPVSNAASYTGPVMNLADLLLCIGWTPAELTSRLSVLPDTVRGWVSGRRCPPIVVLDWLNAVRLGVENAGPPPVRWAPRP